MPLRLLHLVGSATDDLFTDLSRLYATDCLASIEDRDRYESQVAYVTPDGCWRFPDDLSPDGIAAATPVPVAEAVAHLVGLGVDVMVPQMFCLPGMTSYRALFDLLAVPYVGNPPDVMALTANKARAKAVVAAAGVRVPAGEVLRPGEKPSIPPPAVVKPVDADNSLGVALVGAEAEYGPALAGAFSHAAEALVETFVELGREVRCGVLEQDGRLVCLPLEEYDMDPVGKPIRDAGDKLGRRADGDLMLMAKDGIRARMVDPGDPLTATVAEVAKRCHVALGCRHYSLFDFRIDPAGEPWFLEAGLYCSFAGQSVISMMAAAAGIALPELFASVLHEALRP
jgi:D-alanine-D-alanine ligase